MHRDNYHIYKRRKELVIIFILAGSVFSGCSYSVKSFWGYTPNQPDWEDFCAAMEDEFQESPGMLTANYVDADGTCYFLTEDERTIYRIGPDDDSPEAIITGASGCMTVTDYGILFLRERIHSYGILGYTYEYDLTLWQEGIETALEEDCDVDPEDGNMVAHQ